MCASLRFTCPLICEEQSMQLTVQAYQAEWAKEKSS